MKINNLKKIVEIFSFASFTCLFFNLVQITECLCAQAPPLGQPQPAPAPPPATSLSLPAGLANAQPLFGNHAIPINNPQNNQPYHICFPFYGSQPNNAEAQFFSAARINNNAVTDWYISAFGGNQAVIDSYGPNPPQNLQAQNLILGYQAILGQAPAAQQDCHIITINNQQLSQDFWKEFRKIASNPVGRVLLYRILIEIRRERNVNNNNVGCCENGIAPSNAIWCLRNNCRSITITNNNQGFSFYPGEINQLGFVTTDRQINFNTNNLGDLRTTHLKMNNNFIYSSRDVPPAGPNSLSWDIPLFHEMLHWFHFLRNPERFFDSQNESPKTYKHLCRCYYGNLASELHTWDAYADDEEMLTILGSPNYNKPAHLNFISDGAFLADIQNNNPITYINIGGKGFFPKSSKFLNGDDLSENAYRCATSLLNNNLLKFYIRFGHGNVIEMVKKEKYCCFDYCGYLSPKIPNRFKLAHKVATDCYSEITGNAFQGWDLVPGEAIELG